MFGFIKYMWKEYQKHRKVMKVQRKINNIMEELNKDPKLSKYPNPKKMWMNLRWEMFLAKRGFKNKEEYYNSMKK
tara:strand:+ start:1220 stop:1444 length:225 start_codon:yes stop_codon:yes gene_type:complete